jgi:uncharacterized protein (DUF362 family)
MYPSAVKPVVFVVEQERYDVEEIRVHARRLVQEAGVDVRGRSVFVKPSFVYPARPPRNRGVNTQPELLGGVVRALADLGAARVLVGEDCLVGPSQSGFAAMGVLPYLRGYAEPVFLSNEPRVDVRVPGALVEDCFSLPRALVEADLFFSLPKLKVNMYAGITLSVKNSMGLIPAAERLTHHHWDIHRKIVDLYRARLPDFVLTDAVLCGEGQGPMHAEESTVGCLVAGTNGVAVDAVSCDLAGFVPEEVPHLALLAGMGAGTIDLSGIDIRGRDVLSRRRRVLARPRLDFEDCRGAVTVAAGRELACPEGCLGMVRGSLDRWAQAGSWRPVNGYTFIVGKGVDGIPESARRKKTIVVGDCAAGYREQGTFIPGCPVPPMAITYALTRKGVVGPLAARLRDLAWGMIASGLGSVFRRPR